MNNTKKDTLYLDQFRKKNKKDISRKTIVILLIITLLVTVVGTITVLNTISMQNPPINGEYTPTAKVAVSINKVIQNETDIK